MTEDKQEETEAYFVDRLLNEAATIPVDESSNYEIKLPPFYDGAQFQRAQKFYAANRFGCLTGMIAGLLSVLAVPTMISVVEATNQSSNAYTAYRRYIQTLFHTVNWYRYDLKLGTPSWKSVETVRRLHSNATARCQKMGIGFISQKDMSLTQFGFMGYVICKASLLGIQYTKDDMDAFCHFWRVMGYMLGIKDEFNLCTDSYETTLPRAQRVRKQVFVRCLQYPTPSFVRMTTAITDGLWCFNPTLDHNVILYFTSMLAGVPGFTYPLFDWSQSTPAPLRKLDLYRRLILWVMVFVHGIAIRLWIVRAYYNTQMLVSEFMIRYFPILAFYKFRSIKKSYVHI